LPCPFKVFVKFSTIYLKSFPEFFSQAVRKTEKYVADNFFCKLTLSSNIFLQILGFILTFFQKNVIIDNEIMAISFTMVEKDGKVKKQTNYDQKLSTVAMSFQKFRVANSLL
jgi:hypothetical protein